MSRIALPLAFTGVVLIWSTTPLGVKLSAQGAGFLFAVAARMLIGTACILLIMKLRGIAFPWHRQAVHTYVAAALGIYGAMICVYWGSLYIPSGLIAVIFGTSPIITGILAARVLAERNFTLVKLLGVMLGMVGLVIIFGQGFEYGALAINGILAVIISVSLHAVSAVWVKRVQQDLSAWAVTAGGLVIATPLYLFSWLIGDGHWPQHMPLQAAAAIIYLGIMGSVVGFMFYFYILQRMPAGKVALLTLITPILALFVGKLLNHEDVNMLVWIGTAHILLGMGIYQWGAKWSLPIQRILARRR